MLARVLAVLACAGSLAVVPHASAIDVSLVVRGSRSGYVDVTFPATFAVDPYAFTESYRKGNLGGFWAERRGVAYATTADQFGVIRFGKGDAVATARIAKQDRTAVQGTTYAAGTYRIHIVADAPFELTLPVTSGLAKTIVATPRKYVAKPRLVGPVAGRPTDANTTWNARERVSVGSARTAAVSVAVVRWDVAGAHADVLCFAKPEADCAPAAPGGQAGIGNGQHGSGYVFAGPGTLARGAWDAVQQERTAPPAEFTGMDGWALVFDTPA